MPGRLESLGEQVSIEKRETAAHMNNRYSESERAAIYRVIRERRDIPTGYLPEPIEDTRAGKRVPTLPAY